MLLRQIVTFTFLTAIVTVQIVEGKRKKLTRHGKKPKEGKAWRLRAGRIESAANPLTNINVTNESQYEDENYNKYVATLGPQQLDNGEQSTIDVQTNPSTPASETTRWESQTTNSVRYFDSTTEYSVDYSSSHQEATSSTYDSQNGTNPKFNEEIDDLTKNLQQISNDWYYNVRFHCANSWKMIQDILTENRKALSDWQSTLYNIIDMLYIDDNESSDYEDLEENSDQNDSSKMDYDHLVSEVNTTDRTAKNKEGSKWYGADKEFYGVAAKSATESSKMALSSTSKHETQADDAKQGSLKLHVHLGNEDINSTLPPLDSDHHEEVKPGKYSHHSNLTNQGIPTNETEKYIHEKRVETNEYLQDALKYYDKVVTEKTGKNYKYDVTTEGLTTFDGSWWNYYNVQETTERSKERHYEATEVIPENPWKYYYENVMRETTPNDNYEATTESYWKYYYETMARETTENLQRPEYDRRYDEARTTEAIDLRKFSNPDKKRLNKTAPPPELLVRATSQKATRRKKKKKKLYSVSKSETKHKETTTQVPLEDEITSDINLVEALRMYWKQSILECLSKYMKEVKEEEGMARSFNKKMKLITANNLSNLTNFAGCFKTERKGDKDKEGRWTDSWRRLKEQLRSLHQELERRYLNHEVQNLQITMGIETCRQVGLAYENTMHRQVKAIYSTAVRGRYRNKPVAAFKHRRKNPKHRCIKT